MSNSSDKIIVFDFMRTLYDPESHSLIEGSKEVLETLHVKDYTLSLVTRIEGQREEVIKELGLQPFFSDILFTLDKKEVLHSLVQKYPEKQMFVIGDRVQEEIAYGNELGVTTIWFKAGKFSTDEPRTEVEKPTYIISSLTEVLELV